MVNCPNCGTANLDNATTCVNCGRPLNAATATQTSYVPPPPAPGQPAYAGGPPPAAPVPNYLVQSILVTLCCCLPFGVVAIIYAAQVNSKLSAGDYAGAENASRNARMWCWIAFGSGVAFLLIWFLIGGAAFVEGFRDAMGTY